MAVGTCGPDTRQAIRPAVYQPRRPERSVAYQVVQRHLETWLERAQSTDPDGDAIPEYVERDFRQYLTCGILTNGFARARCDHCGHDFLVAFSCKGRGICSACTRGVWTKPPHTWSITSFPKSRHGNGCCRYRHACAIFSTMMPGWSMQSWGFSSPKSKRR